VENTVPILLLLLLVQSCYVISFQLPVSHKGIPHRFA